MHDDLFTALGPEIAAELGERRDTVPRALLYRESAPGALVERLVGEIAGRRALVVADTRTRALAGEELAGELRMRGWQVSERLIADPPGGGDPVCDDATFQRLAADLPEVDVLCAAGSGVVNDLTKWVAHEAGRPYVVLATAASMNGYAAANVAPTRSGVKGLFRARAPRFIAARPSVIESAPARLTTAGLGDLVAKPVSSADWLLNHRIAGEPYAASIAHIIDNIEPRYLERPDRLAARDPGAVRALFEALVYSGCAMTLQGSSLPASGGEHLVSHTLDMLAHVDGVPHDLHGRQVGVATIFAAELYRRIVALPAPIFTPVLPPFDARRWGPIAGAVHAEYVKKEQAMARACERLSVRGAWASLRGELAAGLRDPAVIKRCLATAGGAHRFADLGCTRERFLTALHHAAGIRARFTSLDLGWATGVLPGAFEEIVDSLLV